MTMSVHELLMAVFALAVFLAIPPVAGRLVWCAIRAVRARRYRVAAQAVAGIVFFAFLFLGVLAWWFMLGVSHRQKDIADTYWVMAATGIPYFLAAPGLWRFAGTLGSRLESGVPERSIPAQELVATGGASARGSDAACGRRLCACGRIRVSHSVLSRDVDSRPKFPHAAPAAGSPGLGLRSRFGDPCPGKAREARLSAALRASSCMSTSTTNCTAGAQ
jgi:hypothetical protein